MNVLFIRGLTRESRHWRGFEKKFQLENPTHHIYSIDVPGAGEFNHLTSSRKIDDYVHFLRLKLEEKYTEGPAVLIGISMGGMIALRWGELYPSEVEKVFVINTSASNLSKKSERFNLMEFKTILSILISRNLKKKEALTLKLTTNKFIITDDVLEEFVLIQKTRPVSLKSGLNQLWAASKFTIHHPLKIPLKIISSLKDNLVAPICSQELAEKLKAEIVTHPDAGHDLPLDDPDWLLSVLRL